MVKGNELVRVYPRERVNRSLANQLREAFLLGRERTEQQDIEFPINQLVEIALRAISPAVNDPFTAVRCIDRLSAGLTNLCQREFPSPYRYDEAHNLRVVAQPVTFERLLDQAFTPIRQYSHSDSAVTIRLLVALTQIAASNRYATYQTALQQHAEMILRGSREGLPEEYDRRAVEKEYSKVIEAIEQNKAARFY